MSDDIETVHGSGNVFRDVGIPNANREQLRALLAAKIIGVLDDRKLTVRAAHEMTGFAAADFSRIRRANLGRFTIDRLMTILAALGQEVQVVLNLTRTPNSSCSSDAPTQMSRLGEWIELANSLIDLGYEITVSAAPEVQRNDDHQGDIRLVAVSLIARSLSNMRGTLIMIREKRIVEARVLARCIIENQFWIAGFSEYPDKFRQAMISQDLNKKGSRGQTLFETGAISDDVEQNLRRWMRENEGWRTAKSIQPKQVAKEAQLAEAYPFYELLSSDAHPTVSALDRYAISNGENEIVEIDLDPRPNEEEFTETVSLACYGLVCVLVAGCKTLASEGAQRTDALARKYIEMMKSRVKSQDAVRS